MSKNYLGVEDLLTDESFLSWYFRTDTRCIQQWEEWIDADPSHRARAEQAVDFLRSLSFDEQPLSPGQLTVAESHLLQAIRAAESRSAGTERESRSIRPKRVPVMTIRHWWMAAACLVLFTAGVYSIRNRMSLPAPELHTGYGEIKEDRLPDGSSVVVNADSRLVFSSGWKDGKDREAWLTGEAFFHVAKTPLKSRFIVHVDHFDIIVTGTQFNVVNRQGKANIMLKEGSVTLHTEAGQELNMKPGDFVEYHGSLEKKTVRNDSVLAWKEHKLIFDGTPLRDLIAIIRENYGVTVITEGEGLEDKSLDGIMPNDNLDVLLVALQGTGDFQVIREKDMVIIKRH